MFYFPGEKKGLICRRYVSDILQEITRIREKVGDLLSYDWISVPLVYTQVHYIYIYIYIYIIFCVFDIFNKTLSFHVTD